MPMITASLAEVNSRFGPKTIDDLAKRRDAFSPGRKIEVALLVGEDPDLQKTLESYLSRLPPLHYETLRSALYYGLTSDPPKPVSISWAPAYEDELTLWDTPCGVLVQVRTRYPGDTPIRRG
jgi:hypothetical protein